MRLYEGMFERCVRMVPDGASDGMGAAVNDWSEGDGFDAMVVKNAAKAGAQGQGPALAERFTVTVPGDVALAFGEVFKRARDGAMFRVVSSTQDGRAPAASGVDIAKAECERWVLG